jgi:hypothetical protein
MIAMYCIQMLHTRLMVQQQVEIHSELIFQGTGVGNVHNADMAISCLK